MNKYRSLLGIRFLGTSLLLATGAVSAQAATINVNSNSSLTAALGSVNPGDTIVLADGTYAGFTLSRSGTASSPITIQAANQGKATISSGLVHLAQTSYVVVSGLTLTTSGTTVTVDGESYPLGFWLEATHNCRVTRSTFKMTGVAQGTEWLMLSGASDSNRVDHNEFGPNTVHGCHYVWPRGNRTIPGVTPPSDRTSWAEGNGPVNPNMARNTQIDHNYFHDQASGTAETIVAGALGVTGDYQDTHTLIEYNLFVNCDGDPEVISIKSSSNIIRYNTLRTCGGQISLRSGNGSQVYGNFCLQGGKSGSGGVKLYERNHVVYNNYIDNASEYPLLVGAGDKYNGGHFAHAQAVNDVMVHNTVVNAGNRPVIIGHGSTDNLPLVDFVFANNVIQGTAGSLFDERVKPTGSSVYSKNIISGGSGVPSTGFIVTDPKLTTVNGLRKLASGSPAIDAADQAYFSFVTDDMDGQSRSVRDIGADEFSSAAIVRAPLTTTDVGPNSPSDGPTKLPNPAFSPAGGTYTSTISVTLSESFSGATVHYTTDGTDPSSTVGTIYAGPFNVSTTTTIKAIATAPGMLDSDIVTVVYTITPPTQVADPIFNPGTGTYPAGQQVTITDPTSGASIHYTTDGSTPSETVGTLYTGPITVNVTSVIKAIAFKSGSIDSNVVSGTYTITAPPPPLNFEAESLAHTASGATSTLQNDTNTSGGHWQSLDGNSVGDFIDFTLPSVPAGTYAIAMSYKTNNNRGILSLKVDGTQVGNTLDQYHATPSIYPTQTFGTVTFASAGTHTIRLTVTGKNSASSSYVLSADKLTLTPQ